MTSSHYEALGLRYIRVATALKQKVLDGVYHPGERLSRQHDLAKEHNVSFNTLKQALDLLEREGYIVRKLGQGTYAALPQRHHPVALVVDDDESIRQFFAAALENSDWKCITVDSGASALEQLETHRFNAIFLDLVMPGLNGAETFRQIRRMEPAANVVIITGYPNSDLMEEALQVGPFAVMKKPFTLEDLGIVLMNAVNEPATVPSKSR